MEPLFHFALALLSAGASWLAAIIVVAIAVARVGPIHLNLSIGERFSQPEDAAPSRRPDNPASAGRRINAGHSQPRVMRKKRAEGR
jgi:hypothetical protein